MDTLHFSALPTDQLPATVLPEQTYQIPADAPAIPHEECAAAVARACWTGTGLASSSEQHFLIKTIF